VRDWFNKEHREWLEKRKMWEKSLSQDTYTVDEAAKRLGRSPTTIRNWINNGELRATKVGERGTIIPKQAIVDYLVPPRDVWEFYR